MGSANHLHNLLARFAELAAFLASARAASIHGADHNIQSVTPARPNCRKGSVWHFCQRMCCGRLTDPTGSNRMASCLPTRQVLWQQVACNVKETLR
jgi:hypothetical protein